MRKCRILKLDSWLNRWLSIEVCEIQFFIVDFNPIRECMFGLSFLTTLNMYKDYFKGRKRLCTITQEHNSTIVKKCNQKPSFALVLLSLEETAVFVHHRDL